MAEAQQSDIVMPSDVAVPNELDTVYERFTKDWDHLNFVQHSIAYARKEELSGQIAECSTEDFALAVQISP